MLRHILLILALVRQWGSKNDTECPIYMLESTRIITISLYKELVGTLFKK